MCHQEAVEFCHLASVEQAHHLAVESVHRGVVCRRFFGRLDRPILPSPIPLWLECFHVVTDTEGLILQWPMPRTCII